jgi:hypothetical protein
MTRTALLAQIKTPSTACRRHNVAHHPARECPACVESDLPAYRAWVASAFPESTTEPRAEREDFRSDDATR